MKHLLFFILSMAVFSSVKAQNDIIRITGELKQWHKVTLEIEGPETSEWAKENPFLNYRLDITFSNGARKYTVPGFYAADGNAAESSAEDGSIWKVRFKPDMIGTWHFKVSFKTGKDIA